MAMTRTLEGETPKTDALIEEMLHGEGIPRCREWERLEAHAREMERMAHTYRAIASAEMTPSKTPAKAMCWFTDKYGRACSRLLGHRGAHNV